MRKLGEIIRLQVQTDSLKTGTRPNERYTPTPHLTSVPMVCIDSDGVRGISATGALLQDVHNRSHPRSKFRGDNAVSIGFTGHYTAMRNRFDKHLTNGIAGETMLVDYSDIVSLEDIEHGIVIVGKDREIRVGPLEVAHPCAPFAKFCLQFPEDAKPDRRITEALQFLERGMRGFVGDYEMSTDPGEIHLGDMVYAAD